MKFKQGVKIFGARSELVFAALVVDSAYRQYNEEAVITSVTEGKHSYGSFHKNGLAMDVRTKGIEDKKKRAIFREIKASLTDEFDVILESLGQPQEHIHIECQPKS